MQIDLNKLEVVHNPDENRFETWIDGNLSKLDYIQDRRADRRSQPGVCQREFTARGTYVFLRCSVHSPAPGVCRADPAKSSRMSQDILLRPATREDLPSIVRLLADDELGSQRE